MIKEVMHPPLLILWYMKFLKYDGLATMWDTIYYRTEPTQSLRHHELQHIRQMHRDGKFIYFFKYNWYWIRYGYKNNPYEIEARGVENDA